MYDTEDKKAIMFETQIFVLALKSTGAAFEPTSLQWRRCQSRTGASTRDLQSFSTPTRKGSCSPLQTVSKEKNLSFMVI